MPPTPEPAIDKLKELKTTPVILVAAVAVVVIMGTIVTLMVREVFAPAGNEEFGSSSVGQVKIGILSQQGEFLTSEFILANQAVTGKIVSIDSSKQNLILTSSIFDVSNVGEKIIPSDLPTKEVTFVVSVNDGTAYQGGDFSTLKVGGEVTVVSDVSIYQLSDNQISAKEIISVDQSEALLRSVTGDPNTLFGAIRQIKSSATATELIIESEIPDVQILSTMDLTGSFEVPFVTKMFYVKVGPLDESIKEGMMVKVETNESIFEERPFITAGLVTALE